MTENKNAKTTTLARPKRLAAVAAALALALALGVTAYAADLYGFRALLRSDSVEVDGTVYDTVSITQPQGVPNELAPFISEKLENNWAAWNEWSAWQSSGSSEMQALSEKFNMDGAIFTDVIDNGDGTLRFDYYRDAEKIGSRVFTQEKYHAFTAAMNALEAYESAYDFNYGIRSETEEAALEEIALKYFLDLRGGMQLAWSSDVTGLTGENFFTDMELAVMISEAGCSGSLFYELPDGFNKIYWYDEGSFGVDYSLMLSSGNEVNCYGYNSMYGTLSSGTEIEIWELDENSFYARKHVCPDGTEVTILSNGGSDAYLYVYLENSFFAQRISAQVPLSYAELDAVADGVNYSMIGK